MNTKAAKSTLTYHVSHPLHEVDGVSHAARGKGVCQAGQCDFLVAVPVKSFDSGDSSRDLHMIQVVRGAEFPMVTVRFRLPEHAASLATIHADLEIQFAGQTVDYKQVPFQLVTQGNEARVSGTIPAKLSDFKIEPPTLLAIPTKNEIPVQPRGAACEDCPALIGRALTSDRRRPCRVRACRRTPGRTASDRR